jgi:membrane protein
MATQPAPPRAPGSEPEAPAPQPELHEPKVPDPGLRDLTARDYRAILVRAAREALDDGITDWAAALAYYLFLALPATLLLTLGLFGVLAGPGAVDTVMEKLGQVAPAEVVTLLGDSLNRVIENQSGSIVMIIVGGVFAFWTVTGAMTALMRALNKAYDREESRGFVKQRLTATAMMALGGVAFLLAFGLLILGPQLAGWVADATGVASIKWIWWTAQWPILIVALLAASAAVLYLGPNVDHPRRQFITPGTVFSVVAWLAISGLFAVYVGMFGSYNKTWGSLAAVIVMLTWLWLSALVLLLGAEINAEAERSRELRQGEPAETALLAPEKA